MPSTFAMRFLTPIVHDLNSLIHVFWEQSLSHYSSADNLAYGLDRGPLWVTLLSMSA